jgi:hypothetical protein
VGRPKLGLEGRHASQIVCACAHISLLSQPLLQESAYQEETGRSQEGLRTCLAVKDQRVDR